MSKDIKDQELKDTVVFMVKFPEDYNSDLLKMGPGQVILDMPDMQVHTPKPLCVYDTDTSDLLEDMLNKNFTYRYQEIMAAEYDYYE